MQPQDVPRKSEPGTLEQLSKTYSKVAVAAGVSLLALAAPAEGKVVITTHINISVTGTVSLDLNHDGVTDVEFKRCSASFCTFPLGGYSALLSARQLNGGGILEKKNTGLASNLVRSAPIGKSGYFAQYALMARRAGSAYTTAPDTSGNWGSGQPNHFLGVKFLIHGTTHFGWVRVTVNNPRIKGDVLTATITEYGYETIANKKVLAGLPSKNSQASEVPTETGRFNEPSLGMLALGSEGLAVWRRKEGEAT